MDFYPLLLAVHILGATIWTGGHLVLALSILPAALRDGNVSAIRAFETAFERVGLPALAVQVATGLWLALRAAPVESWADLSDPLGRTIGLKLACLAGTALLAVHARLFLIPNLEVARLPQLGWHIRGVTLLAVLFVVAGAAIRFGGF
jgi:putative copper export protein